MLLSAILALCALTVCYYDILRLAPYQTVSAGETLTLPQANKLAALLPKAVSVSAAPQTRLSEDSRKSAESYQLQLKLGGLVPLKSLTVAEVEPTRLVAGGHSIGILLQTAGVTVVGYSAVIDNSGNTQYPAKEAGLQVGDFVTDINGIAVNTNAEIRDLVDALGKEGKFFTVRYVRDNVRQETQIRPQYCTDSQSFRIGLYVRDNTAGVGTLTYYDPATGDYGALGHMVSDLEHGVDDEEKGLIVRAAIQGVKSGAKGVPGEKLGVFIGSGWQGSIELNGEFGIFGQLKQHISNDYFQQTLPVARPEEVQSGPAQIFTVVEGEEIRSFAIEIVKTMPHYRMSGKGMIIRITDPALLNLTGGIVQGMSGSPIVQNGKLVGAVTHVFINDPTRGYGCFAQWMLEEAASR